MKRIIAERIRQLRIDNGVSTQQMADKLNLSRSGVNAIERGARSIKAEELVIIATLLKVTVSRLVCI